MEVLKKKFSDEVTLSRNLSKSFMRIQYYHAILLRLQTALQELQISFFAVTFLFACSPCPFNHFVNKYICCKSNNQPFQTLINARGTTIFSGRLLFHLFHFFNIASGSC